jgi:hypothetical protein
VDALEAYDRQLAHELTPSAKLAQALDMMRAGIRLKRSAQRRQDPQADEAARPADTFGGSGIPLRRSPRSVADAHDLLFAMHESDDYVQLRRWLSRTVVGIESAVAG